MHLLTLGLAPKLVSLRSWLSVVVALTPLATLAGPDASGDYMIKSVHSGRCLDVVEVSTANGANLQQYGCWSGAANQRFKVSELDNGAYSLVAQHSNKAVDVSGWGRGNGSNIHQWQWFGQTNQQWEIRSVSGGMEIRPRHALGSCLDVSGVSMDNGANIHLWSCHGGNNQKWQFIEPGDAGSGGGSGTGTTVTTTVNGNQFATRSTGGAGPDGSWNIWSNGYIEHGFGFSNPATVTVEAKGDYAGGAWPDMVVSVAGKQVGRYTVNSHDWKTFKVSVADRTGSQPVRIAFINDYLDSSSDRNLYVRSVAVSTGSGTVPGGGGGGATGSGTPVAENGQLRVNGVDLVNQHGQAIQLRGMSSHGLQWYGQYMNSSSIRWLRDDWKSNVVRAAMYTDSGGYIANPAIKNKVIETVDAAIQQGIYVIIDWHILKDNDPNQFKSQAISFFKEMAQRYGHLPNVIYEIANEPNGNVNWNQHIRPYAVDVVNAIRQIDSDNIIIVGTGTWSQDIHDAANSPLTQSNIMYTLHFYAGTHGQYLRDRIDYARSKNAAIFLTEWGTSQASGDGGVYDAQTRTWINFLNQRKISWINWALSDKQETSAALAPGASTDGGWNDSMLSPSGRLVRELMRN